MKNNNNFDFLRFLFSFLVVIGHSILLSGNPEFWNGFFAAMPNFSVYSFFIISGFLIYSSFDRSKNLNIYFRNRIKRIVPAYFFIVITFAFLLYFFSSTTLQNYFSSDWVKYLGANLVFANFLKPCIQYVFENNLHCAVNGSLWTIKVEIMFYVFVPILYYFIHKKSRKSQNVIIISIYFFSLIYSYYVNKYFNYELSKQFPGSLKYFVVGILLYINFDYFNTKKNKILIVFLFLGIMEFLYSPVQIIFALSLGISIVWLAFSKLPFKNFGKYGDFSYGMYLIHFPVIQIFVQEKIYENYSFFGLFLSYVVIIFLSVMVWKLIEEPFLRKRIKKTHL